MALSNTAGNMTGFSRNMRNTSTHFNQRNISTFDFKSNLIFGNERVKSKSLFYYDLVMVTMMMVVVVMLRAMVMVTMMASVARMEI